MAQKARATFQKRAKEQQFPLIPCEYYATMVADSSASVSTIRVCLLKQRLGSEMTGRLVERGLMW